MPGEAVRNEAIRCGISFSPTGLYVIWVGSPGSRPSGMKRSAPTQSRPIANIRAVFRKGSEVLQRIGFDRAAGMNQTITITADDRENQSGVIDTLSTIEGVTVKIRRLPWGDYHGDGCLVFERKTLDDFAVSIVDGRLFRQMIRLAGMTMKSVLILEGTSMVFTHTGVKREAMQGALITVSLILGIPILRSKEPEETARLMVYATRQVRSIAEGDSRRHGYRPKRKRFRQLFILQGLPGVGRNLAGRLLKHFGSIEAIVTASEEELAMIDGIGPHTAVKIRQAVREQVVPWQAPLEEG